MKDLIIMDVDGSLFADSRQVAKVLGVEHETVMKLLREKSELEMSYSDFKSESALRPDGKGGTVSKHALLSERQCLILITFVRNSEEATKAKVALVDAFLEMREHVVGGTVPLTPIDKSEKSASIFINLVRPCESGKILLAHKVCEKHGLPTDLLPAYADEQVTKSMTELLNQYGYPYNARMMNRKLVEKGILEELTRKSKTKGEKKYLSITKAGEQFGKNLVNPQNPRESQPHWFESKFNLLMAAVS